MRSLPSTMPSRRRCSPCWLRHLPRRPTRTRPCSACAQPPAWPRGSPCAAPCGSAGQPCMTLLELDVARRPRARIHVHGPRGRRQPVVLRCLTHHGSGAPFPTFLTLPDFACISRGFDRHLDGRELGQSRVGWDAGPNRQFCHLARGPADCRLHSDFMPTSQSGWAVKHPRQQDDAAVNWDPAKPTCDGNMRMSLCACVA